MAILVVAAFLAGLWAAVAMDTRVLAADDGPGPDVWCYYQGLSGLGRAWQCQGPMADDLDFHLRGDANQDDIIDWDDVDLVESRIGEFLDLDPVYPSGGLPATSGR